MSLFRLPSLLLAGAVVLSACAEDATTPSLTSPAERAALSADAATVPIDRHMFVFAEKTIPADFAERVHAAGGTVEKEFRGMGIAAVTGLTAEGAAQLGASADVTHWNQDIVLSLDPPAGEVVVESADESVLSHPVTDTNPASAHFYARQWHLRQIGADVAWSAGKRGSRSVRVGILDSGIDYLHPDLAGLVDLSISRSFVPEDNAVVQANFPGAHEVADLHYHGTHVASTVASNARLAAGVTSNVTLVAIKVLNRNGSGNSLNTLTAIEYAADQGLDVINMSLGISTPLSLEQFGWFNEMINRAMEYAFRKGVVVVVSSGNENRNLDALGNTFSAYCTATTLTCVSATGPTSRTSVNGPWQNPDSKAGYSNYGVEHINVAAPGGNGSSMVTAACSGFSLNVPVCRPRTFVLGLNGTSMASPHAAAVAALLVEKIGKRQPGLVRQRLQQTADDLGKRGADPIYGKGRVNLATALGL
ncbi:MAG TPA: S8 family serine peptidase [Longimicrobiaceae bacterium]|nr:S8 family serine peptidase [Longimicrobiaceae bacterium]